MSELDERSARSHLALSPPRNIKTLSEVFDPRLNALNIIRLLMAVGVIFWHSYPLTGRDIQFAPVKQFMGEAWVDGFFAISGFLITSSWLRRPKIGPFLSARITRIAPAFYVCLLVTAFCIAPLGVFIQGGDWRALFTSGDSLRYVLANAAIWYGGSAIGQTPFNVPYEGAWNGSLWTLGWELACYLGVLVLGVAGLLRWRWTLPLGFGLTLTVALLAEYGFGPDVLGTASRFALMFLAGALIHRWQHWLKCNWIIAMGSLTVTAGSLMLDDYRIVGSLFWAYAILSIGALLKARWLSVHNDLSYGVYIYAFPVQQVLAMAGMAAVSPFLFGMASLALTLPLAAMSWFWVEKPSVKLKRMTEAAILARFGNRLDVEN
jgi:peptidoglycan/LPS O-acetylase OafA/YrhL